MFLTEAVDKIKTHMLCRMTFPKIMAFMRESEEVWYSQAGHRRQHNMAHAHCMLDKCGYRHAKNM